MTRFEKLKQMSNDAYLRSKEYSDLRMKTFYENVSKGFLLKAEELTIEQAQEEV